MENIVDKVKHASEGLKFCPECGKKLQSRPLQGDAMSCFVHGDFVVLFVDGDLQVRWSALRMVGIYLKEAEQPESIYLENEISEEIARRFFDGGISLLEAWRMHNYSRGTYSVLNPDMETLEKFYEDHFREGVQSGKLVPKDDSKG